MGAMQLVGAAMKIKLPPDASVDASVSLSDGERHRFWPCGDVGGLAARLGSGAGTATGDGVHQACPYSHAIRGNIEVVITLV